MSPAAQKLPLPQGEMGWARSSDSQVLGSFPLVLGHMEVEVGGPRKECEDSKPLKRECLRVGQVLVEGLRRLAV